MFGHVEKIPRHALALVPSVKKRRKKSAPEVLRLTNSKRNRRGVGARGRTFTLSIQKRQQRCVVKISYAKNTKTRSWAAHGEYLQRDHAQTIGEKGHGFNAQYEQIDIKNLLRDWQKKQDEHFFKCIISPENGHRLDLKSYAKELMQTLEKDLSTKLQWVAIDHHNTDHPHLHLLIRGRDDRGKTLLIEREYLSQGMRYRSEELATRKLGLRLGQDLIQARERQINREYVTSIDRSLRHKAVNSIVNYHTPVSNNEVSRQLRLAEIKRLKFLESLGLAERIQPKAWKLSEKLELTLHQMQLSNEITQAKLNHHLPILYHEIPSPTQLEINKPLTGKIVGIGLEEELKDQRYILLDGSDGKIHYLQADNHIIKALDNFDIKKEQVVTFEKKKILNRDSKAVEYIQWQNHHSLEQLQQMPRSRLDRDVIEFVKTHGIAPAPQETKTHTFGQAYTHAMTSRFNELKEAQVIIPDKDHYRIANDAERRLQELIRKRELKLQQEHQQNLQDEKTLTQERKRQREL